MDMSYWKFWLLGGAMVAVIVFSGNDPMQEFAKIRQKNFEQSIQESLNDKDSGLFGSLRRPGGPTGFTSVTPLEQQKLQQQPAPEWLRDPLSARPPGAPTVDAPANAATFTPDAYLRSGERIQYVAGKVYRLKEDGTRDLLPDGRYTLSDGTTEIIVLDGTRVAE